jgi:L-iditol 2-dehydrogenase
MKLARYVGDGRIEIRDEPVPEPRQGGIVIETSSSGLCSGELMAWYMERKVPHVLGHEVCGSVIWSDDERFPLGARVAPHHHAPCFECDFCQTGRYVHCETWRRTRLEPGGMAERFFVSADNLGDAIRVDDLRPEDAALIEPLACVAKSLRRSGISAQPTAQAALIGLGTMGLMHAILLGARAVGYDLNPLRKAWAIEQGVAVGDENEPTSAPFVFVFPGTPGAMQTALEIVEPGGTIVMFSPFAPGDQLSLDWDQIYFKEITLTPSYSCGPNDTAEAAKFLRDQRIRAEQVVSDFIGLDELPLAYEAMRRGDILKAMVMFT